MRTVPGGTYHAASRAPLRDHWRRASRILPYVATAWGATAVAASRLSGLRVAAFSLFDVLGAVVCALVMGLAMAWFETRPVRPGYVNRRPWLDLALRTALYAGVVSLATLLARELLEYEFPAESSLAGWPSALEIFTDRRARRFLFLLLLASFAINFVLHLRLAIGPDHLLAFFTGKYRLPVEEERLFLFIDLIDSTAIAQRLGALEFTHFKHDFFSDLAEPIEATDGAIVQYVGDEVMLTWHVREIDADSSPLRFVLLARRSIDRRRAYYEERYGAVPSFRSGMHAGTVVVAEVGDLRRDIVYSGDVVNAAARLLQSCRPEGCEALVSRQALRLLTLPDGVRVRERAGLLLRGRAEELPVAEVEFA